MDLKWFGTATVILQEDDCALLFDPFISMNPNIRAFSPDKAEGCTDILITHGHFDHLVDVPGLVERYGHTVHCSKTAAETLMRNGVDAANVNVIKPGDRLNIGPFSINVLEGKHIKFDLKLIRKTLISPRVIKHFSNLRKIAASNKNFPEGEVLVFHIKVTGKELLAMGSMNLAKKERYPKNVDLLMLPFQGRSDINKYAFKFVKKLKPKAIYLHHFDDTFPPISRHVDFSSFQKRLRKKFAKIKLIVPGYGENYSI